MKAKLILLKKSSGRKDFAIRLTDNGKRSYRFLEVPFTVKEWDYKNQKLKGVRPGSTDKYIQYTKNQKFVSKLINKYQEQIDELIRIHKPFSFQKVFEKIDDPRKTVKTVYEAFRAFIQELKAQGKYGNMENYQGTYNKLKRFHEKDMLFNEMDDVFLLKFKKSMSGLSKASVSIHLRNIRAIYNYAIEVLKVAQKNDYPFTNSTIMKELNTGHKSRAISKYDVDKIRELKPTLEEGTDLWHACNYFIFGYVGRGINFTDIARLNWDQYSNSRITFIRFKTRSKVEDETSFGITDELAEMLSWYRRNNTQLHNPYIFPILNASHQNEASKYNRIKKMRKPVNSNLKKIGEMIDAEIPLTTYVWRHTFASVAKNELNVDVSMISEMLGHHDLETTKAYLKNFPDKAKDLAVIGL